MIDMPINVLLGGVQAFARRLYRFLKRALTLWPQQRAMEPLIALWLAYLAPWGAHSFGRAGASLSREVHARMSVRSSALTQHSIMRYTLRSVRHSKHPAPASVLR